MRHGYDLGQPSTLADLCASTGLGQDKIKELLAGSVNCTIDTLCRVSEELNVPAGEVLNFRSSLTRIYAIDGSSPITVVLNPEMKHLGKTGDRSLFYVRCMDGSYADLPLDSTLICLGGASTPVPSKLYLLENDTARFVRRCVSVNSTRHEAVMTDDADSPSHEVVPYQKFRVVSAETPLIMGTVLLSLREH